MLKKILLIAIIVLIAGGILRAIVLEQDKDAQKSIDNSAFVCSAFAEETAEPISVKNEVPKEQEAKSSDSAETSQPPEEQPQTEKEPEIEYKGEGMKAIADAAKAKKYLFLFFYKDEDDKTNKMREVLRLAMKKVSDKAGSVEIDMADPLEKEVVDKYQLGRAPMPLVLVLASNGAVTGGFPVEFDEKKLMNAFVSPAMEKCLKALQDRKLVFLCVQNKITKLNNEAMQGVLAFKADKRFAQATEIITLDPSAQAEVETLKKLQIDHQTDEAITAFLAPPGSIIGKFKGKTEKEKLIVALQSAMSSCGPGGCGPSGCGPGK